MLKSSLRIGSSGSRGGAAHRPVRPRRIERFNFAFPLAERSESSRRNVRRTFHFTPTPTMPWRAQSVSSRSNERRYASNDHSTPDESARLANRSFLVSLSELCSSVLVAKASEPGSRTISPAGPLPVGSLRAAADKNLIQMHVRNTKCPSADSNDEPKNTNGDGEQLATTTRSFAGHRIPFALLQM